jgi:hypothetical protein
MLLTGIALVIWHNPVWWWIEVHTGIVNEAGPYYGAFSGVLSDIGEVVLIGGVAHLYVRFTCHEPKCFWPGHLMADGHTRSCWHHHPEGRPQPGHILHKYNEHQRRTGGTER